MATAVPLPLRERGVCCAPPRRMSAGKVGELSTVLKALADPTRLEIVGILRNAKEPICICDLQVGFDLSQPTLSHHMATLRKAGLVESGKTGIWAFYALRKDLSGPVRRIVDAIA
jgi:ArsR family transcriptional regulator, arsenate/arsenite/antimonite-responsive transcriptional repressor